MCRRFVETSANDAQDWIEGGADVPEHRRAAYLSHSYRAADRDVNEFFWHALWDAGFTGTVDRKSGVFSAPRIEMLIGNSTCFVAVVTHRPAQPYHRCSPFVVYEHGLAVRADKQRLVFVEAGVSARPFRDTSATCAFDRDRLADDADLFAGHLERLRRGLGVSDPERRLLGKVGLLLGDGSQVAGRLTTLVDGQGYESLALEPNPNLVEFTYILNELDFVIVDLTPGTLPGWVHPFLLGKFVPNLAILHLTESVESADLSPLFTANMLPGIPASEGPVVMWSHIQQLEESVERHLLRLSSSRRYQFPTREAGDTYFRSQGREARRVFLSNFNDANEFAGEVCQALDDHGIPYFHYKYHNTIQPGSHWQSALEREIEQSDLFVALITPQYWQSEWAQKELTTASTLARAGMLDVIPYFLGGEIIEMEQGRDMRHVSPESRVRTIVRDIDNLMLSRDDNEEDADAKTGRGGRATSATRRGTKRLRVDAAIVTVLPEEYAAVLRHLKHPQQPKNLGGARNKHAWQVGQVPSQHEEPYSVVVAMAGTAGNNNAVNVVRNTVEQFHPHYVLLVGIAGGLMSDEERRESSGDQALHKGDVVVSSAIYGYEYGKIDDGGFLPRHDLTYQVDASLLTAAQALPIMHPNWFSQLRIGPPEGAGSPPRVLAAPVASGDKVIDDPSEAFFRAVWLSWPKLRAVEMEGAGAATAVKDITESGKSVGLAMIRGISDLPTPVTARADAAPAASAQTTERDQWKNYAADAAAVFATQLISRSWPLAPRGLGR